MNQTLTLFLERVANSYQRLAELPELDQLDSEELTDLFMNIEALIHAGLDQGVLNQHKPINYRFVSKAPKAVAITDL